MNCKEKYGLTPKQISSIYEGRCCYKARYLLEMRKDAKKEDNKLNCIDEYFLFCEKNSSIKPIPLISKFKPQFVAQNFNRIKKI